MNNEHARAIVALAREGVRPGRSTLADFASLVCSAEWPADADIALITVLGGKVPLRWSDQDTAMALTLPGGRGAIYLALAGQVERPAIVAALRGADTAAGRAVIIDLGIDEGLVPG